MKIKHNKTLKVLSLTSLALLSSFSYSNYEIIMGTVEVKFKQAEWLEIAPKSLGLVDAPKENPLYRYGCTNWAPLPADQIINITYTQTATNCKGMKYESYIKQEKNSSTGEIRDKGVAYNDDTSGKEVSNLTNTKDAVGTSTSYLVIVNPVSGQSGIYDITDGLGNKAKAYVDMNTAGGNWILVGRWTQLPAGSAKRNFQDVAMKTGKILSYSNDTTNYPVIPSGSVNISSAMMVKSSNPTWTSMFGAWQTFSTFNKGQNIAGGFSVNTPIGSKTLYPEAAGWPGQRPTDMTDTFGLWTVYGAGGPCGGAGVAGPNRICPSFSYATAPHFDVSSLKEIYVKSKN